MTQLPSSIILVELSLLFFLTKDDGLDILESFFISNLIDGWMVHVDDKRDFN